VSTFAELGLRSELLEAVAGEGYIHPTPIQRETIPIALEGRDVVGSAQTGTGKTAAFMLPSLQRLAELPRRVERGPRMLVLVPTRELAEQVLERARAYGTGLGMEAAAVYGGIAMGPQEKALRRVEVIVATPGRFLDHLGRGNVDCAGIEILVLDEADRMLDMGFAPDVFRILDAMPKEKQTLLFSATISHDVDRIAKRAMAGHTSVEIGERASVAEGVEHGIVAVDKMQKRPLLAGLLKVRPEGGRALIFTRTKWGADALAHGLTREGIKAEPMHGDLPQRQRQDTLDRFREGSLQILVATDVAARGIDVDDIEMVVNFDVPDDPEVYVHRVGRTARAGARGLALTLVSPDEWLLIGDIERLINRPIPREVFPGFEPSVAPLPSRLDATRKPPPERSVLARRGRRKR
jgi:ATP-dependent RNA helicase RhlE